MEDLTNALGIKQHITRPDCPWLRGSSGQRFVVDRALCSELQIAVDEWDLVMPLAENAINNRRRNILGDRSVVEIVTGRQPRTTADLTLQRKKR